MKGEVMRKKKMQLALAAVLSVSLIALAGCSAPEESGKPSDDAVVKLTVVHPYATPSAASAGDALDAIGIKYGFFEEEGIEIVPQYADGSTAAVQALLSGSADISAVELAAGINAGSKGIPLTVLGSAVVNWPWKMSTLEGSPIADPKDLKGQRIGVISLASGSYTYTKGFLNAVGLSEADVEIIPVGTGPAAIDAISQDKVDVLALYDAVYAQMVLAAPDLKLAYIPNPKMFDEVVSLVHTASGATLEKKSDAIRGYLRAYAKALVFAGTNPEAAALASWELNPSLLGDKSAKDTLPAAAKSILAYVDSAMPRNSKPEDWRPGSIGDISKAQWNATNKYLIGSGLVEKAADMDSMVDLRFIEAFGDFDFASIVKLAKSAPREP